MRTPELVPFLAHSFQHRMQVLVKGNPGGGKSDCIDAAIEMAGADRITRHPAIEEPVDSKGYPIHLGDENFARWMPFRDLYELITAQRLTVVHLEDLGQAKVAVQASYMQLLLRRELNGQRISDHVVFTASTNLANTQSGVEGIIEPVKGRFDSIVELTTNAEDWVSWGARHNMPPWLLGYIKSIPAALHEFKATKDCVKTPSPRGWASVGRWSNSGINNPEVWSGAVGVARGTEAHQFWTEGNGLPDMDECIKHPDTAPLPTKRSFHWAMAAGLATRMTDRTFANIVTYTKRLGREFEVFAVNMGNSKNPDLFLSEDFGVWADRKENRDIVFP